MLDNQSTTVSDQQNGYINVGRLSSFELTNPCIIVGVLLSRAACRCQEQVRISCGGRFGVAAGSLVFRALVKL